MDLNKLLQSANSKVQNLVQSFQKPRPQHNPVQTALESRYRPNNDLISNTARNIYQTPRIPLRSLVVPQSPRTQAISQRVPQMVSPQQITTGIAKGVDTLLGGQGFQQLASGNLQQYKQTLLRQTPEMQQQNQLLNSFYQNKAKGLAITPQQQQAQRANYENMLYGAMGTIGGPNATGFKGATGKFSALFDKKPRFEIADNKMQITSGFKKLLNKGIDDFEANMTKSHGVPLNKVIKHEELFKNYPQLQDIKVRSNFLGAAKQGSYDPATKTITINESLKSDPKALKSNLLHEIQHIIQDVEGFARGGSSMTEMARLKSPAVDKITAQEKEIANQIFEYNKLGKPTDALYGKLGELQRAKSKVMDKESFTNYRNLAGEIEARAVAKRRIATPKQRATVDPYMSSPVLPKDMVVRFDRGVVQGSEGKVANAGFYDTKSVDSVFTANKGNQMYNRTTDSWHTLDEIAKNPEVMKGTENYDSIMHFANKFKKNGIQPEDLIGLDNKGGVLDGYHRLVGAKIAKQKNLFTKNFKNDTEALAEIEKLQSRVAQASKAKSPVGAGLYDTGITVERYQTPGQLKEGSSVFFSPKGRGVQDYGTKKVTETISSKAKLYEGQNSYAYVRDNNLFNKKHPELKELTGYDTLKRVDDAYQGGNWTGASTAYKRDPNIYYQAFQRVAQKDLQKKGYQGAKWLSEDELSPQQYQIWDKSVLKSRVAQPVADTTKEIGQSIKPPVASKVPTQSQLPPNYPPNSSSGGIITDPVQKVIAALKEAKPIRSEQQALYSAERGKRVGQATGVGKNVSGERGYFAQLSKLKGELPKAQFEGIRNKITQQDVDSLFNTVEQANLTTFEKISAKGGLAKLLAGEGGQVPTKSEINLLNEIFPPDFTKAILDKRSAGQKIMDVSAEVLNIPRSLMASFDLSAPLRQGAFFVGRPKQWGPGFKEMLKSFASEKNYQALLKDIESRPTYLSMRNNKLAITNRNNVSPLTEREEAFMSNYAERIPGIGKIVRMSDRAYTGFLNKIRADVYDDLYRNAKQQGILTPKLEKDLAEFINTATGRGDLGKFNRAATVLNGVFFSPRLLASRLQLMNPQFYIKLDPFVRKEALESLFTFGGTALTVFGLAKLAGADVGADPRSADFAKIKVGNTRYDVLAGFQQPIRLAAQLITGEKINSSTGELMTLGDEDNPYSPSRFDIGLQFFQSKESPVASFITQMLQGKNGVGEKFDLPVEVVNRFIPMVAQDMYELQKEWGPKGLLMGAVAPFGVGTQTYGRRIPTQGTTAAGNPTIKMKGVPGLADDLVNLIRREPVSNIPQDQWQGIIDAKQQATDTRIAKDNLKAGSTQVGDKILYIDSAGKTQTFDLAEPTKGQGIDAFVNSDWKAKKAVDLWGKKDKFTPEQLAQAYTKLGYSPEDARYAYLASKSTDISTQYIESKSPDHKKLMENLTSGRMVGITGTQFASNGVIDAFYDKGLITEAEKKALKAMKFDKNGKDLSKPSKGKKIKVTGLSFKGVQAPSFDIPTSLTQAQQAPKMKVANFNFQTPFSGSGSTSVQAPKFQVKFNNQIGGGSKV